MRPLLIQGLALWLLLAAAQAFSPELNDLSVKNALGGGDVWEELRSAREATAQRVDEPEPEPPPTGRSLSDLRELGPPRAVPSPLDTRLREILTTAATYQAPPKRCSFRANTRCVWDNVAVVFCFGCGELEVWRHGKLRSFAAFDSAYGPLLQIFQQIFPEDEFLRQFSVEIFEQRVELLRDAAAGEEPPPAD